MTPDQLLRQLAQQARGEEVPRVDVTDAVLERLSPTGEVVQAPLMDSTSDRIWVASALGAIVAASIAFMLGYDYLAGDADPVYEILQTVQVISR